MPLISQTVGDDYAQMYSGYDQQKVGLGMVNPNVYATPSYQKKKIKNLAIGGISKITYAAFDHDPNPLFLSMAYEGAYNTVIGVNLHYVPPKIRQSILKFILDSNAARIRANQPIMIDWHSLERAVPYVKYITRRYKIYGIGVKETIPLVEWPNVLTEKSPWEGHFKTLMEASKNSKKRK